MVLLHHRTAFIHIYWLIKLSPQMATFSYTQRNASPPTTNSLAPISIQRSTWSQNESKNLRSISQSSSSYSSPSRRLPLRIRICPSRGILGDADSWLVPCGVILLRNCDDTPGLGVCDFGICWERKVSGQEEVS